MTDEKKWDMFCENNDLLLERDQLEAENAKLRELVMDMWQSCPVYTADCYGCEYHRSDWCKLYDRMRELGIEVE